MRYRTALRPELLDAKMQRSLDAEDKLPHPATTLSTKVACQLCALRPHNHSASRHLGVYLSVLATWKSEDNLAPPCSPRAAGLAAAPPSRSIPGTTKLSRLEENIGAAAVELTSDDLREIEDAASRITVAGARYPEELERRTGL